MPFFVLDRRTKFLLLVAFMVLSIASLPQLPFNAPWGIDLQNVHAFQKCAAGRSVYLIDAAVCGRAPVTWSPRSSWGSRQ